MGAGGGAGGGGGTGGGLRRPGTRSVCLRQDRG